MDNDGEWQNGTFQLHGEEVWGRLKLDGGESQLNFRVEGRREPIGAPEVIHGRLHDFKSVSCVACVGGSFPDTYTTSDGSMSMSWKVFPHQVLVGKKHFHPATDRIAKVWFSTTDLQQIFRDFDSFRAVWEPSSELKAALPQTVGDRPIPFGPDLMVAFFGGRSKLLEVELEFGKLEVQCWAVVNSSSTNARIDSQMRVYVEFKESLHFDKCLSRVRRIVQFLSLVSGRSQGIDNLQVVLENDENTSVLDVYWSLSPEPPNKHESNTPSSFDMPLDGIRRSDEFCNVIRAWFGSNAHEIARARLYSCSQFGSFFHADRLIAAANLFDLTASLKSTEIHLDLDKALTTCLEALNLAPPGHDRDGVIQAIKRVGSPTLMNKVLARARVWQSQIPLQDFEKILRQAVLFRNYFVHGSNDSRFNYAVAGPYMAFLTSALEFTFAAAELVECGWDGAGWRNRGHTRDHWFSSFIAGFNDESASLLLVLENAKKPQLPGARLAPT